MSAMEAESQMQFRARVAMSVRCDLENAPNGGFDDGQIPFCDYVARTPEELIAKLIASAAHVLAAAETTQGNCGRYASARTQELIRRFNAEVTPR